MLPQTLGDCDKMFNRLIIAVPLAMAGALLLFAFIYIWFPSAIGTALQPAKPWFLHLSHEQRHFVAYIVLGTSIALGPAIVFGITAYRIQRVKQRQGNQAGH